METVWYGSGALCISSQAGCAVGCPFCASGARGLFRSLSSGEMVEQVAAAERTGLIPSRITVSGIGEPLHNPASVRELMAWCRRRNLPVSLTTTGSPLPVLEEFIIQSDNGLMLSVHAGTSATHRRIIPRGPDYDDLWSLLGSAWPYLSRRRRRKIGINYLLLEGFNDGDSELSSLIGRLRPFPEITVHLLVFNPIPGKDFRSPSSARVNDIYSMLADEGFNVRRANFWRRQREGGCGTLLARKRKRDDGEMVCF